MKEFNLEEAKQGARVCTREGHKARIVCFDAKSVYPIVALVDENGWEWAYIFTQKGRINNDVDKHGKDLMLVGEKHEGWVVVFYDTITRSTRIVGYIYDTKELALEECKEMNGFIGVSKIEWED